MLRIPFFFCFISKCSDSLQQPLYANNPDKDPNEAIYQDVEGEGVENKPRESDYETLDQPKRTTTRQSDYETVDN